MRMYAYTREGVYQPNTYAVWAYIQLEALGDDSESVTNYDYKGTNGEQTKGSL